jgi:hypothetical protein
MSATVHDMSQVALTGACAASTKFCVEKRANIENKKLRFIF